MIDATEVRRALRYEPETGEFFWRPGYLRNTGSTKRLAGRLTRIGYREIRIGGKLYQAHRLAWLYVHGEWPPHQIDHINLNKSDNRLCNLRRATAAQNQWNYPLRKDNTSGHKGVVRIRNRWRAQIRCHGRLHYVGQFESIEDAAAAYASAANRLFGEFARPTSEVE